LGGIKFDTKTRDAIFTRLKKSMLAMETELLDQIWKAVLDKNKKPTFTISKETRKAYHKELFNMMYFFFLESYNKTKKGVQIKVKELEEIPVEFLKAAYTQHANTYMKWFSEQATKLESKRFQDTVTRAKETVTESIEQGLTRPQVRELLAQSFGEYSEYELDRVITTEGTRAMNLGTVSSCQDDDNIIGYQSRVNYTGCEICDAKEAEGMIPKDELSETPPYHPNCNCSLEPVFKDEV
jgi:hypothetical protein